MSSTLSNFRQSLTPYFHINSNSLLWLGPQQSSRDIDSPSGWPDISGRGGRVSDKEESGGGGPQYYRQSWREAVAPGLTLSSSRRRRRETSLFWCKQNIPLQQPTHLCRAGFIISQLVHRAWQLFSMIGNYFIVKGGVHNIHSCLKCVRKSIKTVCAVLNPVLQTFKVAPNSFFK